MSVLLAIFLLISSSKNVQRPVFAEQPAMSIVIPMVYTLAALRDRNRPLLVFAPTDKDSSFQEQVRLFGSGSLEYRNRQVLFVPLLCGRESKSSGVDLNKTDVAELKPEEAVAVRRRFHIAPNEFAVILIGKDGGEKFRSHTPVTIERLITVIDAMPMRQQEVQDGRSK